MVTLFFCWYRVGRNNLPELVLLGRPLVEFVVAVEAQAALVVEARTVAGNRFLI